MGWTFGPSTPRDRNRWRQNQAFRSRERRGGGGLLSRRAHFVGMLTVGGGMREDPTGPPPLVLLRSPAACASAERYRGACGQQLDPPLPASNNFPVLESAPRVEPKTDLPTFLSTLNLPRRSQETLGARNQHTVNNADLSLHHTHLLIPSLSSPGSSFPGTEATQAKPKTNKRTRLSHPPPPFYGGPPGPGAGACRAGRSNAVCVGPSVLASDSSQLPGRRVEPSRPPLGLLFLLLLCP